MHDVGSTSSEGRSWSPLQLECRPFPCSTWSGKPVLIESRDTFVLQYPHHDPTVLLLGLRCLIRLNLTAFAHGARRQHVDARNAPLLHQELDNIPRTVFA